MTDRPIIFSAPMVLALLAGRKTQTRRIIAERPPCAIPGDRLWVREAWRLPRPWDDRSGGQTVAECLDAGWHRAWAPLFYEADGQFVNWGDWREDGPGRYRHARFMPRAYSRLTLTVTDVWVERVQDITEDDARAEGARPAFSYPGSDFVSSKPRYVWGFQELWGEVHGPGAWERNDWVAAYKFTVKRQNIDERRVAAP